MPGWLWALIGVHEVLVLWAVIFLLRKRRDPRAMIAWILALLLVPVLGLFFFALLSEPRRGWLRFRRRRRQRRIRRHAESQRASLAQTGADLEEIPDHGLGNLAVLAERLGAYRPTRSNDVKIYHDAEQTFDEIKKAIGNARSSVHLEYYIFQPDDTGEEFRELLTRKAREGIHCRLLLDFVGSWWVTRGFLKPMKEAGVETTFSLPMVPLRGRLRVNYRNHRKIAVIDGQVGFTGSQNIGDEYRGRLEKYGPWRDTHLRILGPCVNQLQEVFARDWYDATKENIFEERYFPPPEAAGQHIAQIVPSGPDQRDPVMHQILFAAVSSARDCISVITPYFVPDHAMILVIQSACYRGVRVRLIISARTDSRLVLWAGRSYYEELLGSGVEIYEHDHAFLHSKVVVIDDSWGMVGSCNIDERSFRLNFELTTMLYSEDLAEELYKDFESLRVRSRRITMKEVSEPSFGESLLLGLARLASPVL